MANKEAYIPTSVLFETAKAVNVYTSCNQETLLPGIYPAGRRLFTTSINYNFFFKKGNTLNVREQGVRPSLVHPS